MRNSFFILTLIICASLSVNAQYLKKIAAFDNNYNDNSGIIAISDTAVYEYSWYMQKWMLFPSEGLTKNDGVPIINDISTFDNDSWNPSGIYVISDTAVFVYNYYAAIWYPIVNNGLPRHEGEVQISSLSAHKESSNEMVRLHVVADTAVYRYDWYGQNWYPLSNQGLILNKQNEGYLKHEFNNYPNPFDSNTKITYNLPDNYKGQIRIAVYDINGIFIKELNQSHNTGGNFEKELEFNDIPDGIYFYEISGNSFSHVRKMLKISKNN
jgi:hypothetical protein